MFKHIISYYICQLNKIINHGNYLNMEVQRKREDLHSAGKVKGIISGMGLMLGIETDKPAGEIAKAFLANGLLILTEASSVAPRR